MICTSNKSLKKIRLLCLVCVAVFLLSACGSTKTSDLDHPFDGYSNFNVSGGTAGQTDYFAADLCVSDGSNIGVDEVSLSPYAEGEGVFNLTTSQVTFSKNIFEQLYPASTTKILTAYIIIKDCDLNAFVTVSDNAVDQPSDSSVCGLHAGDILTVEDLLYGLMLPSGNDAAIALAEFYSGSTDEFAKIMNATAQSLGATNSNFVNPNGMSDENHYTTVYDMYLITKEAIKLEEFRTIIATASKTVSYTDITGASVQNTFYNTNKYVNGQHSCTASGVTVIGGKTGTTGAAGYCLVLYSVNANGEEIITIVYKSDNRADLYGLMDQLLLGFTN